MGKKHTMQQGSLTIEYKVKRLKVEEKEGYVSQRACDKCAFGPSNEHNILCGEAAHCADNEYFKVTRISC